jgi:hypothetical protein
MIIEFLLRQASRGDRSSLEMATHAMRSMARGGMYDLLGGGFARYSVDSTWLIPHFEKMLYDNAQLARVYLHAYLLTGEAGFRHTCEATLDFVQRELTHPLGGFFCSLDADSEGEEGKYYLWTPEEIYSIMTNPREVDFCMAAFGVNEGGNFEGKNILWRATSNENLAEQFNLPIETIAKKLELLRARLLEKRSHRVRPTTDDKVLVSWNALMLTAFAEAGWSLGRPEYIEAATRNADFILCNLLIDGQLLRSWREGKARHTAFLEDHAGLALGLLSLYQADPDVKWYQTAVWLMEQMLAHYQIQRVASSTPAMMGKSCFTVPWTLRIMPPRRGMPWQSWRCFCLPHTRVAPTGATWQRRCSQPIWG